VHFRVRVIKPASIFPELSGTGELCKLLAISSSSLSLSFSLSLSLLRRDKGCQERTEMKAK
jgi:hypothetical protein